MVNLRKIDKFWLSGGWDESNLQSNALDLANLGFKAVIDMEYSANWVPPIGLREILKDVGIEYANIPMNDWGGYSSEEFNGIMNRSQDILRIWDYKYNKPNQKILVKCAMGISRSSSVLINYLCYRYDKSFMEVWDYVREKEEGALYPATPNSHFSEMLNNRHPDKSRVFSTRYNRSWNFGG
jgi:protein-tyrosine phosphatase